MDLTKGANTTIAAADGTQPTGLVVGVGWDSGALECDVCALVCDSGRRVVSDAHMVFWNQPQSPERAVSLLATTSPVAISPDRAQVVIDLTELPEPATRIVMALATVTPDADLSPVRDLRLRVVDAASGEERATYSFVNDLVAAESCLVLGEVYLHQGGWKFRAVGQGFSSGLAGLSSDYGVNLA